MCRNYELPTKESGRIGDYLNKIDDSAIVDLDYTQKIEAYRYFMDQIEATYFRVMRKDLGKLSAHGPMPCAQFDQTSHDHAICIECESDWPCTETLKAVMDARRIAMVLDIKNALDL